MTMQPIRTSVFSVDIPDFFDYSIIKKSSFRADSHQSEFDQQYPHIRISLQEIEDVDDDMYEGDSLAEKLEDSFLSSFFKAEKIRTEEIIIQDRPATVIYAKTDAPWQEVHFNIKYLFASILLNDVFYLEVVLMHEPKESDGLDAWVTKALDSIKIFGNEEVWGEALKVDVAAEEAEWQKQEELLAEPKKIEYEFLDIPKDGKDVFSIGDFQFSLIEEDCEFQITELSREFDAKVVAKAAEVKKGKKEGLLSEWEDDGKVSVRFSAKGIHENGIPTGKFTFEEGKTGAPLFGLMYLDGIDTALNFFGTIEYKQNWMLLSGFLKHGWENRPTIPVTIAKKFTTDNLHWNEYRFGSLEETVNVDASKVRFLNLENPVFAELPKEIFSFDNLEELSISQRSNHWETEKMPLNKISDQLGELTALKSLHVNGASLEVLPESIGRLKNLEQLSINNCLLKSVPESIWQLPKLRYLWLSSNQLNSIPEEISLPELRNLSIEKNQFKTLPEALAKQPKLEKMNLDDNPLENLPSAFNEVAEIELSMEDKKRLLDFEYQGADGKGMIAWDDSVFWSQNDADLLPEIKTVILDNEMEAHEAALCSLVKKSIGFAHKGEEDYSTLGNNRFGGMPDLPKGMDYPEFFDNYNKKTYKYEFIGQINCAEVAHLQYYLPRTGMLYFFLETIHNIYDGTDNPCKVIYSENDEGLVSGKTIELSEADYFEMIGSGYKGYQVTSRKMNSAPSFYASYVNTHLFLGAAEKLKDDETLLEDLYDFFEEPLNHKNPFGYAVNSYGFSQHEHPELQASLKQKGNPEDWIILLTVTSSGEMQWGDAGDLFYVIHKSDLAKCDFSNVFVTMESS